MTNLLSVIGPSICGVVYFATSTAFLFDRRYGWSLAYFAYALANVGLVWASMVEKVSHANS